MAYNKFEYEHVFLAFAIFKLRVCCKPHTQGCQPFCYNASKIAKNAWIKRINLE